MKRSVRLQMSERHALHKEGNKHITPVAIAAARAVFDICGGADGWRSWVVADGKMVKLAHHVIQDFLSQNPSATAEALYAALRKFPAFIGEHASWVETPPQVRAAYEAFCAVYRQLWRIVRGSDATMAQALAWRPPPRLVERPRYLPKLSEADVVELQVKLGQLGYSEREIKYRLTDPRFNHCTRDRVLWDAEEMACYRIWCDEEAKKHGGQIYSPQHEPGPDRPYLQALYDEWTAYYANPRTRDRKSWVHTGLPSGRG